MEVLRFHINWHPNFIHLKKKRPLVSDLVSEPVKSLDQRIPLRSSWPWSQRPRSPIIQGFGLEGVPVPAGASRGWYEFFMGDPMGISSWSNGGFHGDLFIYDRDTMRMMIMWCDVPSCVIIAMENQPFTSMFPSKHIKTSMYTACSIAMFDFQMVSCCWLQEAKCGVLISTSQDFSWLQWSQESMDWGATAIQIAPYKAGTGSQLPGNTWHDTDPQRWANSGSRHEAQWFHFFIGFEMFWVICFPGELALVGRSWGLRDVSFGRIWVTTWRLDTQPWLKRSMLVSWTSISPLQPQQASPSLLLSAFLVVLLWNIPTLDGDGPLWGFPLRVKGCKPTPPCFPPIGFRENLQETPRIWALNPWFPLGPRSSLKPIKVWDDLENQGPTPPHPQVQRQTVPLKPKRQQLWHHPVALQALQGEIMGYDGIWWDMLGYDGMKLPLVLKISINPPAGAAASQRRGRHTGLKLPASSCLGGHGYPAHGLLKIPNR